jgi:hypothetical protein
MLIRGKGSSSIAVDTAAERPEALMHVSEDGTVYDATIHLDSNACRVLALQFEAAAMELDARAVR